MIQFGHLTVGQQPRVVGTISTWEFLRRAREVSCDIVEVRLDLIGAEAGDWVAECRRLQSLGVPVILTIRLAGEGGQWTGSEEERLRLFLAGAPVVSAMDLELRSDVLRLMSAPPKPVIVSYHDFERTPPLPALLAIVAEAARRGSVVKIATLLQTADDVESLRQLLRQPWSVPLCVMGMGALGAETRVEFPRLGSSLTYGYLDAAVAPGQVSAGELWQRLGRSLPGSHTARNRHGL